MAGRTGEVGRFGLANPGHPSNVSHICLLLGNIHKYYISSAKNGLQLFLGECCKGVLCDMGGKL